MLLVGHSLPLRGGKEGTTTYPAEVRLRCFWAAVELEQIRRLTPFFSIEICDYLGAALNPVTFLAVGAVNRASKRIAQLVVSDSETW